ncbi:MAG: tripartite tricarboxylate transporter substrate-binding protein [Burkholderiaceae bacterium]|nr:tripartite tricarboxylate transporter substrate-binding protein [Burkholderiaceae bacterium]
MKTATLLCFAAILSLAAPSPAPAQSLAGGLRIVVPYAPGGASDRAARLVADGLKDKLQTTIVVENRTGAGGRLAMQQLKATPAGQHVLVVGNPALMVVAPVVYKDVGYDARHDFVPVSHITNYDFAVAVGSAVPVREFNHLAAWLRANPEQANFGVPATGSLPHFFALMIADSVGVKPQIIGYRGSAPSITDLMAGTIPVAVDTLDALLPHESGGKIRILAMAGTKRSAMAPKIPTLLESGQDIVATGWNAMFAPASMPKETVQRIGLAIRDVMRDKDVRAKFEAASMEPISATPEETARMLGAYRAQWEPVVKKSGFTQ